MCKYRNYSDHVYRIVFKLITNHNGKSIVEVILYILTYYSS